MLGGIPAWKALSAWRDLLSGVTDTELESLEVSGGKVKALTLLPGVTILVLGGITVLEARIDRKVHVWFLDNTSRQNLGEVLLSYGQFAQYAISYRFFDVKDNTKMRNDVINAWRVGRNYLRRAMEAACKVFDGANIFIILSLGFATGFLVLVHPQMTSLIHGICKTKCCHISKSFLNFVNGLLSHVMKGLL